MRVLLTEDDVELANLTGQNLKKQGFSVDIAYSGRQALGLLEDQETYDVVVLDLGLPDIDGTELLRKFKSTSPNIPVLALTARDAEENRINGIQRGFDDYMTKPFSSHELAARIRVLSRLQGQKPEKPLTFGSLKIFPSSQKVLVAAKPVKTSLNEFRLLYYLIKNKNRKISSQELLEAVWDRNSINDKPKLMTTISRLRKKIGDEDKSIIKTAKNSYYIGVI